MHSHTPAGEARGRAQARSRAYRRKGNRMNYLRERTRIPRLAATELATLAGISRRLVLRVARAGEQ